MKTIAIFAGGLALTACNNTADAPATLAASNDIAGMAMSATFEDG